MAARFRDLDALRAARAEATHEPPTVLFFGETVALPVEMPFAVIHAFAVDTAETFNAAVVALIGDEHLAVAIALGANEVDMTELLLEAAALYGADPEVSSASPSSSETDGARLNPTSAGTTGSTSDRPASDRTQSAAGGSAT